MAKAPTDIRSLARSHTETALRTLAAIMNDASAPAAARATCANSLLDRGWGKAEAIIKSDVTHRFAEVPKTATDTEWDKILASRSGVPSQAPKQH